ncbi:MAG: hypothetical protein HQK54_12205 [Oligoflexales bacterium]|nr:hypothetical protein [Oligoflexales bacterium]
MCPADGKIENLILESSKRYRVKIMLDADLICLAESLKGTGFKIIEIDPAWSREELGKWAEGYAILTKHPDQYLDDAVFYDYDIISIEDLKFDKNDANSILHTTKKIVEVIHSSRFHIYRGNFHIQIYESQGYFVELI